jgi:hypothetical protein
MIFLILMFTERCCQKTSLHMLSKDIGSFWMIALAARSLSRRAYSMPSPVIEST